VCKQLAQVALDSAAQVTWPPYCMYKTADQLASRNSARVVFETEASEGGGNKAGGLPHPSLSLFSPLPLSIPLSSQTNQ